MGFLTRLYVLRNDIVTLWRAFWHVSTPLYLKAAMLGLVIYVISPIDLLPEFLGLFGIIDDVLIIGMATRWIVSRLPDEVRYPDLNEPAPETTRSGPEDPWRRSDRPGRQ